MFNDTSIRDWIAVLLTFGVLGLVLMGQFHSGVIVPDRLWDIYFTVIGFFFATTPKKGDTNATTITTPTNASVTANVSTSTDNASSESTSK